APPYADLDRRRAAGVGARAQSRPAPLPAGAGRRGAEDRGWRDDPAGGRARAPAATDGEDGARLAERLSRRRPPRPGAATARAPGLFPLRRCCWESAGLVCRRSRICCGTVRCGGPRTGTRAPAARGGQD
ncbi:MAG: hypothetical protein AVDCRST_MAG18-1226, partial [uncultured Thermomicrobiales bacterium]